MKKLLLIFFILPGFCIAQKDTAISFTDIVKVDSTSKDVLFQRARDWFNNTFRNSKEVLQIQDKETCEISGKGIFSSYVKHSTLGVDNSYNNDFRFQITIWVKDGKYKYSLTDIDNYRAGDNNQWIAFGIITSSDHTEKKLSMIRQKKMDEYYMAAKNGAIKEATGIILLLKEAMKKNASADF